MGVTKKNPQFLWLPIEQWRNKASVQSKCNGIHVKSSSVLHLLENSSAIINCDLVDFYETT